MTVPAPMLKPRTRTTMQVALFDVFEVQITTDTSASSVFDPRPRLGFSPEDAVLALAETLKLQGTTPDAIINILSDTYHLCVVQQQVLEYNDRHFEVQRIVNKMAHDTIMAKLVEYYPVARRPAEAQSARPAAKALDVEPRMIVMEGGSNSSPTVAPKPVAPRRLITVQGEGNAGEGSAKLAELAASLTPESIKGGLVLVSGKNGTKIMRSNARVEEDESGGDDGSGDFIEGGDDFGDDPGASNEVTIPAAATRTASVETEAAPRPQVKRPPAPTVRTVSGSQAERMTVSHVERPVADVDPAALAAMDAEMGGRGEDPGEIGPLVLDFDAESTVRDMASVGTTGGRRVKTQSNIVRKDRGGSRPVRPKA